MAAGYPSWKALLRDIAEELDIDLDSEPDLAGVAQWYINHKRKLRTQIGRVIVEKLPPVATPPESLRVLGRLPLKHVWTTNYDRLIETAWEQAGKNLAVRTRPNELAVPDPTAHATLYKMHGSVDHATEVVIAKEDYELYRRDRGAFFHLLTGHAIGMSFLFLGFSFTDANISHLFGLLREILTDAPQEHYAIVRRPAPARRRATVAEKEKARRELSRHKHWVDDLQRYGIECVEVDDFSEIVDILKEVEQRVARTSIFVSGSYPVEAATSEEGQFITTVAEGVGRIVVRKSCRLVSGFGLTVGSAVVSGCLSEAYKARHVHLDSAMLLRPFPQTTPAGMNADDFKRHYREDLVSQAGVCVVVGGKRKQGRGTVVAPGVLEEVEIAKQLGRPVLPLGRTGGAAQEVWETMSKLAAKDRYGISDRDFKMLGPSTSSDQDYLAHVESLVARLVE